MRSLVSGAGTCLPTAGPTAVLFLIACGLDSLTALRKTGVKVTVYKEEGECKDGVGADGFSRFTQSHTHRCTMIRWWRVCMTCESEFVLHNNPLTSHPFLVYLPSHPSLPAERMPGKEQGKRGF